MVTPGECPSGTAVLSSGRYELCDALGHRTGLIVEFVEGEMVPAGPKGWFWSIATEADRQGRLS